MPQSFCVFRIKNELDSLFLLNDTSYEISYDPPTILYLININSGIYKDRSFSFQITFPPEYPFTSPRIKCLTKIFHPSIDNEGNTCLEILRHNWKCIYGIQNIFVSLVSIFSDLEVETPLNTEAGDLMEKDMMGFIKKAQEYR